MSLLRAESVSFTYGPQTVLGSVDLTVGPGDRIAVVGPNGVGKSTLLRLLAQDLPPEQGSVTAVGTVGLLPQERDRRPGESIQAYLARRTGVAAAERAMLAASEALAAGESGAGDAYAAALERYLCLGGPDLASRAAALGAELGVPSGHDRATASLSGGEAARLGLAAIMLSRFDVTLLDEPGNDLDLDGLARLEDHLRSLPGGAVIVSHDRELLRRTATDVVQIDPHSRRATRYGGGYDTYLVELERDQARRAEEYAAYAAKRDELTARARAQREWASSGSQRATSAAARAKEPDKFIRHAHDQGAQQTGAKAAATLRSLERLNPVAEPRKEWELHVRFGAATRGGDVVATVSDLVVRAGDFHLGPVSLRLDRGDRATLLGPNGSGKTTLVDVLLGRRQPDAGSATLGAGVVVGEIGQHRATFDEAATLIDGFTARTRLAISDARKLLAKFGLGADDVLRPVGSLSPGERTRADLALLMHRGANLLVLDEPTNHLDLPAIIQLEQALNSYDGTFLLVTHDRKFLENVRVTRYLQLDHGVLVTSSGTP
ncbi:MAG TPA: ABC-F family ATP-binding cassette domain-containing protein [Streptosporangiaceae bacterium]|nr:ABC-F family ATP-binding cassette domain-containing protein [Streptosporangiaceae bacterium]